MAVEFRKKVAVLSEVVSIEDAEPLLAWMSKRRSGVKVDLGGCTHLHPANLQVLLAAGVEVTAWPADIKLANWLQSILPGH